MQTPYGPLHGEATLDGDRLTGSWKIEGVMEGGIELTRDAPEQAEEQPEAEKTAQPKESGTKEPEPTQIDFEGLEDRIHRISIPNASESRLLWSSDSKKLAFSAKVKGVSGLYTVEYAHQTDADNNPSDVEEGYYFGELGASLGQVTARVGYEVQGGSTGKLPGAVAGRAVGAEYTR